MTFAHADTDHASHHNGAAIIDCRGQCPAALNIRGQRFNCEWPVDPEKGVHEGWSHSSKAARAVWVDDRGLNAFGTAGWGGLCPPARRGLIVGGQPYGSSRSIASTRFGSDTCT
jgi:hypothetical protein